MAKRGGFPGGMPGNMANLMKQAQKMQRQMEEQAKEMETKEFSATAGGGAVEATVSGISGRHVTADRRYGRRNAGTFLGLAVTIYGLLQQSDKQTDSAVFPASWNRTKVRTKTGISFDPYAG